MNSLKRLLTSKQADKAFLAEFELRTKMSSLHCISTATISILERAGSSGNSTMWRPSGVRLPVLSRAPRIHNWYIEFRILSCEIRQAIGSLSDTKIRAIEGGTVLLNAESDKCG